MKAIEFEFIILNILFCKKLYFLSDISYKKENLSLDLLKFISRLLIEKKRFCEAVEFPE